MCIFNAKIAKAIRDLCDDRTHRYTYLFNSWSSSSIPLGCSSRYWRHYNGGALLECVQRRPVPHPIPTGGGSRTALYTNTRWFSFFFIGYVQFGWTLCCRKAPTDAKIDELQGKIEEEVNSIATSNGYGNLTEDDSYVLGQWVHSERSDVEVLRSILADLHEKGPGQLVNIFKRGLKRWQVNL